MLRRPGRRVGLGAALALGLVASAAAGETPSAPQPFPAAAPSSEAPSAPAAAPDRGSVGPGEAELRAMVRREAEAQGLPPELAEAVATVESGFEPRAVGGVGEIGLMQVLPSTARMLGFSEPLASLFDPATNIRYGVRYLSEAWRLTGEDICGAVMKYRAGHGETRFSHRSVAYCVRVRELLAASGFTVTGEVPAATFGAPAVRLGPGGAARRLAGGRVRMRFNWANVDLRRRALDRAGSASLRIAD